MIVLWLAKKMMNRDLNFAKNELIRILNVLNIKINSLDIKQLLNCGSNKYLMVEVNTTKGCHQIPCEWSNSFDDTFILNNILLQKQFIMNSFVNHIMPSIIFNMGKCNDTDPIEILMQGLCLFWDQVFRQVGRHIIRSSADGLIELKKFISKTLSIEHKNDFIILVTSALGNQIYYSCGMNKRLDITRERNGSIY